MVRDAISCYPKKCDHFDVIRQPHIDLYPSNVFFAYYKLSTGCGVLNHIVVLSQTDKAECLQVESL